jgi:hypothetical protein
MRIDPSFVKSAAAAGYASFPFLACPVQKKYLAEPFIVLNS